jgi:hypothetical protein
MLPVLKTLMSTAWARGKGPKQIVKVRKVAPARAILIARPQRLVWNSHGPRNYTGGRGRNSAAVGPPAPGNGTAQDCVVVEAVLLIGPVSMGIFPVNREKNREIGENRPSESILKRLLGAASMACRQISYEVEQGIFSAEQGSGAK